MAVVGVAVLLVGIPASALAQNGSLSGTVTRAATGQPVTAGVAVLCSTVTSAPCLDMPFNASGGYSAIVPAGTYVIFTKGTGLADEIADGIVCPEACEENLARIVGAPFTLPSGGKVVRNFALHPAGSISGMAIDAATRAPIANLQIAIATKVGAIGLLATATTNASGVFSFPHLGAGRYAAYTGGAQAMGYTEEIFGNIACPGTCHPETAVTSGTPVQVTPGTVTGGLEFALDRGAVISGTVTVATIGGGPPQVQVAAHVRMGSGLRRMALGAVDGSGTYTLGGLPAGSYFLATSSDQLVDEVHDDSPCLASCTSQELAASTPVTVGAGQAVSNVDFQLTGGGSLSGTITEAGTGTPQSGVVLVYRKVGSSVVRKSTTSVGADGAFVVRGLAAGTYVVLVRANAHALELFGGVQLPEIDDAVVATGTPVTVANGATTPGVDVVVDRAAAITGTVRQSPSNAVVARVRVELFRAGAIGPELITAVATDDAGAYTFGGLPAGTYFVATRADRLANHAYNGVVCPADSCSAAFVVANGTGLQVGPTVSLAGIDFLLSPTTRPPGSPRNLQAVNTAGGVHFTWLAPAFGGVATSYLFEAGLSAGTTFATVPVSPASLTVPGVPPGTYFVRVRGVNTSGVGAASAELTVIVGAGGVLAPEAPIGLTPGLSGDRLTLTWLPASRGPVPTSYLLEVGSAVGLANIAVLPVAGPLFQFTGVPPGFYYVRVRAVAGGVVGPPSRDELMVAGTVPAPPGEPGSLTSRVAGNVVTLSWFQPTFGPVTSYVLEAGTASGLSNIAVFNTGNASTALVVPGVPPGKYFLRLRAVNAQGVSLASIEHVLVVP